MAKQWIDFAALKQQTGFIPVLKHYGIEPPKTRGGKIHCCFHEDKNASLSIDTQVGRGKFQCFGCGQKGNVLEFVRLMDECSLPEAATKVAELHDIPMPYKDAPTRGQKRRENDDSEAKTTNAPSPREKPAHEASRASQDDAEESDTPINQPLSFTLKLDAAHPYVGERLDAMNLGDESSSRQEIVETFGLGVASRGMMKDRLAIPIHDEDGELIAYAGRWARSEDEIPEDEEKYKLPPRFKKSHALFNLNRILTIRRNPDLEHQLSWVVITEGYFGTIRLHALGIPAVSIMGTSISDGQIKLLDAEWNPNKVILLFDGDDAGKTAAQERVLPALAKRFFVNNATAVLDDNEQPDEMTDGRLLSLMKSSEGW